MLFVKHTGQVTAPVASRPPCTLLEKFGVVFQRSLNFGLGVVLHERFPAVRYHPTGDKVVVVCVQLVFTKPPFFVGEGVGKSFVLEDLGAICDTASRHAGKATVDMRRRCTLEVATLQIQSPEEIVDALGERWRNGAAQSLAGDHATIPLVLFEWSQKPRHGRTRPTHVIISKDRDGCADLWNGTGHLTSFVGMCDSEETDSRFRRRHGFQHRLGLLSIGLDGHQQKLVGSVVKDCSDGLNQFIATTLQGRDDHCDILSSQSGGFRWRDGFEGPEGDEADHQAEVTIDAAQKISQSVQSCPICSMGNHSY